MNEIIYSVKPVLVYHKMTRVGWVSQLLQSVELRQTLCD